jgi:hypothetical protein
MILVPSNRNLNGSQDAKAFHLHLGFTKRFCDLPKVTGAVVIEGRVRSHHP